ncbi:MAG: DUF2079 domain-containing protein [Oscillatoriaceae bacterium SKW80]|nr:DUF2079 domain-containing protein [Oscillatoriaceae bacterium SKYG93]MCX8121178.1 DUF2079 domain-containing protein [Oscillatoriaceae bacterium SKW80]MDW8453492.1 DUF2079 domain-containing protein [Oscillatoriaceae cyanobacterium SKYGB_i_bin93]HIK26842.1 DUF2079 domain-containing protein [Oscillatoriaceae cyanobacterium M7585_C2015_266]
MSKNIHNYILTNFKLNAVTVIISTAALIFFACSSLRHALFQSGAFDLGIFDQAIYLISIGEVPISSFTGFHILGDHAAWILYPLALLYKISANVHWLFAVQALSLALGALPTWHLARVAGLSESTATTVAVIYLLYPLVFNLNLFDFHPEVIALPCLLGAILAAQLNKIGWFCVAIALILSCKAVLALTVAAMGIWLFFFEKKRACGIIALFTGVAWFLIATQIIIPFFGGEVAAISRHFPRYSYLGNSFPEMAKNILLHPWLVSRKIFSFATLEYLLLLTAPLILLLSPRAALIGAIPTLVLNILSENSTQRNLVQQYSLPILPFLLVTAIANLSQSSHFLFLVSKKINLNYFIFFWSLIAFLILGKYGYFASNYLKSLDNWQATREAIAQITTKGGVLTTHEIAPHLSTRSLIKFTIANSPINLAEFKYILLNLRHPGWLSTQEFAADLVKQLKNTSLFELAYQRDDVYLFIRK